MSRKQLAATAVLAVLGLLVAFGLLDFAGAKVALAAAGMVYLVAFPATTLRLMLLTISWDIFLTVRVTETVTVRFAHVCALVLFALLFLARLRERGSLRFIQPTLSPLALYFGGAVLAIAAGVGSLKSVGYLGWGLFDAVVLFAVITDAARTEKGFRTVAGWWIAGAAMSAGLGAVQLATAALHLPVPLATQFMGRMPRINGFNYEPAYFAFYVESVAAVLLGRWLVKPAGAGRNALLALGLLGAAAVSTSRSGWLGLGLLTAFAALFLLIRGQRAQVLRAGVAALVLGGAAFLVLPKDLVAQIPRMAAKALDRNEVTSTAPRLAAMRQAWRVFKGNPIVGVGTGGYAGYIAEHPELHILGMEQGSGRVVTTNLWLEIAAEGGVVGLFALLWLLGVTLAALFRTARAPGSMQGWATGFLMSLVLVFGVLYQFNQTLWRLDVWTMLALAWSSVALARREASASQPEPEAPPAVATPSAPPAISAGRA